MLADGRRLLIYMDEFWQWINNEAFRDFVYNKLKTARKLDMVLVVATQSPDELIKSPIAAAVREQCATHIYLANPKAKRSEYVDELEVRELYFDKIKAIDPLSRQFLGRQKPTEEGGKVMILRLSQDWIWEKRRITYRFSAHRNPSLNCSMKSGRGYEAGRVA